MPYMKNPLQEAHCNDLDYVIQRYPGFKATLEALERCGLPCTDQLSALESAYNVCTAVRKEFNPLAPPLSPPIQHYHAVTLNERQCRDIDSIILEYPGLKETILALERCGIPCRDALDSLERHFHICVNMKKEFNPTAP